MFASNPASRIAGIPTQNTIRPGADAASIASVTRRRYSMRQPSLPGWYTSPAGVSTPCASFPPNIMIITSGPLFAAICPSRAGQSKTSGRASPVEIRASTSVSITPVFDAARATESPSRSASESPAT